MTHFTKLSWAQLVSRPTMTKKLAPTTRHAIVQNYLQVKAWKGSFESVKQLCESYSITRNTPIKLLKKFQSLRKELHGDIEVDYKKNIFLERVKLRKHRTLPEDEEYKRFLKKYPRGGYQTYESRCDQEQKEIRLKEGKYYYYKPATKADLKSKAPSKKPSTYKWQTAKERYEEHYLEYDFVIHLDGKSFEDQERIWKNPCLKLVYKWISMAVEAKSWTILGIRLEKSHNKTNALLAIKEICEHIENSFGADKKILFITDAWSEYLNDKKLRGIDVTDLDTSRLVAYLRERKHTLRITRRPQDNGFIENKNDYIERSCLDDESIKSMNKKQFIEHLDRFIQRNNIYLKGCKKSFRGKGIRPLENIQSRFGEKEWEKRIKGIHTFPIEQLHRLPRIYEKMSLCSVLEIVKWNLSKHRSILINWPNHDLKTIMHPKSIDSSGTYVFPLKEILVFCKLFMGAFDRINDFIMRPLYLFSIFFSLHPMGETKKSEKPLYY